MNTKKKHLLDVLSRMKAVKMAVAGDLIADVYVYARPAGLSREAPVMVMLEESERIVPGGAANALNNILELAGRASTVGIVGDDAEGKLLCEALRARGVDGGRIIAAKGAPSYSKTRVFAGDIHTVKQQVFRIDSRPKDRMTPALEKEVLAALAHADKTADAWLVSDYDADFFSDAVIDSLNSLARRKPMVVDSHARFGRFRGVACATPNEAEAEAATGIEITDADSAAEAGRRMRRMMDARYVFVTRGNDGMTIVGDGKPVHLPIAGSADIVDVAGAGDTVAAVVALCMALGEDARTAGELASFAASVVCMKTGVATASPEEIRAAIEGC